MELLHNPKRLALLVAVYFFIAWSLTGVYFINHAELIPKNWEAWHQSIADGTTVDSGQFRLMSFWAAELIQKAFGQPVHLAYLTLRFVCTFFTMLIFHMFLLKWFEHKTAMLGTTLFAAMTPLTYLPLFQEADVLFQLFFLIGLWLARENKLLPLLLITAIGTFAKENMLFVIPFYALIFWRKGAERTVIRNSIFLTVVWTAAFYLTRNAFYEGANSVLWQFDRNFEYVVNHILYNPLVNYYIFYIPLFGIFWLLPFLRWKQKPAFFKRVAWYAVVYTILHFMFGWPHETRILLPLAFLIIPAGIIVLFPESLQHANKKHAST